MAERISNINRPERTIYPQQSNEQLVKKTNEKSVPVAGPWNSGISGEDESVVITSCDIEDESAIEGFSDSTHTSKEFSSSENSSGSDDSKQQRANRAASKMNAPSSQLAPTAAKASSAHHPSKFCLSGVSTSFGFSAAVAGFTATAFLYDLITRFPERATTEIGVALGTSIVVALGGTITCSTSMVFLVRELCKTSPG